MKLIERKKKARKLRKGQRKYTIWSLSAYKKYMTNFLTAAKLSDFVNEARPNKGGNLVCNSFFSCLIWNNVNRGEKKAEQKQRQQKSRQHTKEAKSAGALTWWPKKIVLNWLNWLAYEVLLTKFVDGKYSYRKKQGQIEWRTQLGFKKPLT